MSSSPRNVDFILEQIGAAGTVSARKMFGEYAVFCNLHNSRPVAGS